MDTETGQQEIVILVNVMHIGEEVVFPIIIMVGVGQQQMVNLCLVEKMPVYELEFMKKVLAIYLMRLHPQFWFLEQTPEPLLNLRRNIIMTLQSLLVLMMKIVKVANKTM